MSEDTEAAWASVGRTGYCAHSKRMEGCAGCYRRVVGQKHSQLFEVLESGLTDADIPVGFISKIANVMGWEGFLDV